MIDELGHATQRVGRALAGWAAARQFAGVWQGSQMKADVDRRANDLWHEELRALSPGVPIVSEEVASSHLQPAAERHWIIDPLDGTASFVGGFKGWVTQVALMENGRPVLAAVFAPLLDELWLAAKGRGATLNGTPLVRKPCTRLETLIDNYPEARGIAHEAMEHFLIPHYVECGSLGLKICKVAQGVADLFIKDVPVKTWDIAPAELILAEAGGTLVRLDGTPFDYAGSIEHQGLIAAADARLCEAVAVWQRGRVRVSP